MQKSNDFLGTEPVGKLLFRLALPAVLAQLINMLYNVVDRIFIGHIEYQDGTLALTGVGVCLPLILIVSAFASLVSTGGAPRASIDMGRGDDAAAEKTMGNCFILLLGLSVVLTGVLLVWHKELLMAFGASPDTIGFASAYIRVYALGTVFVQTTLGMNAFITCQGHAKTGMLTVLIGAVCNIALDWLFIDKFQMGVQGAALATILSQGVSALWVVSYLAGKKSRLRLRAKNFRLSGRVVLPCIALGSAPFVMQASESVLNVCFNASLQNYGGDMAVGAMTILSSVGQFAMLPVQGVGQGAQPITSYNFGARNPARVKKTFFLLLRVSLGYSALLWLCVMLFPQLFARIFTPNPALIAFTGKALRVYFAGMLLFGAQTACQMTFVALGNAAASISVAVVRKFVLLIPLIYILPAFLPDKTQAVYLAEPVADVLAVAFTVILFAFQFKKALEQIEQPLPEQKEPL